MSTSLTRLGGVVVITQVIQQGEASIPLHSVPCGSQATPTTAPALPPAGRLVPPAHTKLDELSASFLQGMPQGLGAVQIIIGVLCILFSLRASYSQPLVLHAPLCLALTFVVSGSLTLATLKKTSVSLVWATFVSNIISVLVGMGGVAYLCFLIAIYRPAQFFCEDATWGSVIPTEQERKRCLWKIKILDASEYGSLDLLVVLLVLQVCVSITVSVFSARAIRRHRRNRTVIEVLDDARPLLDAMAAAPDNNVAPAVSPR